MDKEKYNGLPIEILYLVRHPQINNGIVIINFAVNQPKHTVIVEKMASIHKRVTNQGNPPFCCNTGKNSGIDVSKKAFGETLL